MTFDPKFPNISRPKPKPIAIQKISSVGPLAVAGGVETHGRKEGRKEGKLGNIYRIT